MLLGTFKTLKAMWRILIAQLFLVLAMPVNAAADPEIHKLCLEAVDYKGCVSSNQSQPKLDSTANKEDTNTSSELEADQSQEEANDSSKQESPKKLSAYGITNYGTAVTWCKRNLNGIDNDIFKTNDTLDIKSISEWDFCRKYFIDSLKSNGGDFCEDCGLDPNNLLDDLVQDYINKSTAFNDQEVINEEEINKYEEISESNEMQETYTQDLNQPLKNRERNITSNCPEGRKNYSYTQKINRGLFGIFRKKKEEIIELECLTPFEFAQTMENIELRRQIKGIKVQNALRSMSNSFERQRMQEQINTNTNRHIWDY